MGERLSIMRAFLAEFPEAAVMRPANVIVFVMAELSVAVVCVIDALAGIRRAPGNKYDAAVMQHSGTLGAGRSVAPGKAGEDSGISGFAENGFDIERPVSRRRYFDSQLRV